MELILGGVLMTWLSICVIAVALCVVAGRGDGRQPAAPRRIRHHRSARLLSIRH